MKAHKKRICVIGLGQFGGELAVELAKTCDVLALDDNSERVHAVSDRVQRAVITDAKEFANLADLVSPEFDEAVVSLGESIEAGVLCTLHLKKIGVKSIRAKAVSEDHATVLRAVGAGETIFPERETARRVAAQIMNPNLLDFIPIAEDFQVIDLAPPDSFQGKSLLALNLRKRFNAFVIAVRELIPERFVFLPGPEFVVKPSDILVVIGRRKDLALIRDEAGGG
jgi:trk system potassium uptake protein TrkA